ncbi:MAG: hypothetical protein HY244_02185 [Rhizobiales bacterium]|nr:hypothetical protein [Hyphomicrobiales bacterium]
MTTLNASKATEQSQDSKRQYTDLDSRYGKIGISAVAAALRHQGEQHNTAESHYTASERD